MLGVQRSVEILPTAFCLANLANVRSHSGYGLLFWLFRVFSLIE